MLLFIVSKAKLPEEREKKRKSWFEEKGKKEKEWAVTVMA